MTSVADLQGFTFEMKMIRPNHEKATCKNCGEVHDYWSQQSPEGKCTPILIPDQWVDDPDPTQGCVPALDDMDLSEFVGAYTMQEVNPEEVNTCPEQPQ